ncbi:MULTISPECIES: hypothetical protein [Bradyrhizobium]|uniref:hypothetical protein n=1 Tax=Bradyrhizobium TaxID=374 RepID=UPI0024BF8300|nr:MULTISPECIES: hypothetical protein [Bradyrhizobium]
MSSDVSSFPAQLMQGYAAFMLDRFPQERQRFDSLAARGAVTGSPGDRMLRQPRFTRIDIQCETRGNLRHQKRCSAYRPSVSRENSTPPGLLWLCSVTPGVGRPRLCQRQGIGLTRKLHDSMDATSGPGGAQSWPCCGGLDDDHTDLELAAIDQSLLNLMSFPWCAIA